METPPVMTRLKSERLARGWSQITLAYKARVANSDVSKWERGIGVPYPSQARRIAKVLGVRAGLPLACHPKVTLKV